MTATDILEDNLDELSEHLDRLEVTVQELIQELSRFGAITVATGDALIELLKGATAP